VLPLIQVLYYQIVFMKYAALVLFGLMSLQASAQKPVRWKFSAVRIADRTYEIHLTAKVEQPWHIYSQTTPPGGPAAAKIEFSVNPIVAINGTIREAGELITTTEKLFGVKTNYYEDAVDFIQQVKIKSNGKTTVTGYVQYMVANTTQSLPVTTVSFNIALH
jgi:hypothetical protein